MSLQHAAKHLAAHGRHGDTHLVHMSAGEIRGLQDLAKLHGTKITINPHTGLPEAFSLKSLLPAIAGAGLTVASGGALSPLMAGLIVGGGTAVATGSLEKGLMTGLGAYGGAGLGAGITPEMMAGEAATGAGAATAGGAANMAPVVDAVPSFTAPPTEAIVGGPIGASAGPITTSPIPAPETFSSNVADYASTAPTTSSYGAMGEPAQPFGNAPFEPRPGVTPSNYASSGFQTGPGPNSLKPVPTSISDALSQNATFKNVAMAAAPVIASGAEQKSPISSDLDTAPNPVYRYEPGVASPFPQASSSGVGQNYFPGSRYVRTAADGGMMYGGSVPSFDPVVRMAGGGRLRPADSEPMKKPKGLSDMPGLRETAGLYAKGGISDLGGYSDGGRLLRGPGDGVSDSIPARIGNKQPARLADGEFVVPARIVSELGNGSTEAGARQLYAMMDRVQKARGKTVGKGRVAKKNNPTKMLPA